MIKVIWLCLLLFIEVKASAQVKLCHQEYYVLDGNVYELREPEKKLSVKEAWSCFNSNKFVPILTLHNELNKGFVSAIYWLAIPIKNPQNEPETLEAGIANAGLYHLEYYLLLPKENIVIDHAFSGKSYNFSHRVINNRHYYFPFSLKPHTEAVILYRIDLRGNGFNTPLRLVTSSYRAKTEAKIYLLYAFACGLFAFVCLFSLLAFFWIKDRIYLFYSAYIACGTLFFLADGDLDFGWLYPNLPGWALIAPSMYGCMVAFFMLLFMINFLRLASTHAFLYKLSVLSLFLLIFIILLIPISHSFLQNIPLRTFTYFCGLLVVGIAFVLQIFCIVQRIRDHYKPAYLYGVAILFVLVAVCIYIIHSFDFLPAIFPSFNYILCGFLAEVSILSFALLYDYNYHQKKYQEVSVKLTQQQLDFTRQLLEAQESEQKRIAEDLHDELGGNLAVIKLRLQNISTEDKSNRNSLIDLIDKASDKARFIAHNLMPPEFANIKMHDLLQDYFNWLKQEGSVKFYFHYSGENGRFNKQHELIIYRIILELVHNIIKHAEATEATVQLVYYNDCLEIMAEDNGKGFKEYQSNGIGLKNIQSRVNYLGGKLNIDNSIHGTTIIIKLPY